MKKWLMMCFALLFALLVTPITALADSPEPEDEVSDDDYSLEMEGLVNEWETSEDNSDIISPGFPENVGHVYFDNDKEKVIIGLVDNTQSAREDIRSMLDTPKYLEFESSQYAYNDLIKIFRELHEEVDNDDAVYSVNFAGDAGTVYANPTGKQFGENGHEQRIRVEVDESVYDDYKEKYATQYGDKVYVDPVDPENMQGEAEDSEESALPGYQGSYDNANGASANQVWISVLLFLVLALFALFIYKRKRLVAIRQTAGDGNVTESRPLSRSQVTSFIKESGIKPGHHVDEAILKKIRDQEQ